MARLSVPFRAVAATLGMIALGGAAAAQSPAVISEDIALWRSISSSSNPALFRDMVDRFPQSPLTALARIRLDELTGSGPGKRGGEGRALPQLRHPPVLSHSKGVPTPSFEEIRRRAVAIASRSGNMLAAPRQGAKSLASLNPADIVTVLQEEGQWLKIALPGGATGHVEASLVEQSKPDEFFFAGVMTPTTDASSPLDPVMTTPERCLEQPSKACLLSLLDPLVSKLDRGDGVRTLAEVAALLFNSGYEDTGQSYLQKALALARASEADEYNDINYHRADVLDDIASKLAAFGQPRRALEVYAEALFFGRRARSLKEWSSDAKERAYRLRWIARRLASGGLRTQAESVYREALGFVRAIPLGSNPSGSNELIDQRFEEFRDLADERFDQDQVALGFEGLATALTEAAQMSYVNDRRGYEDNKRPYAIQSAARKMASIGYIELALGIARSIGAADKRAEALAEIAREITPLDSRFARVIAEEAARSPGASTSTARELIVGGFMDLGLAVFQQLSKITDSGRRTIAGALARVEEFDRAIEIAKPIEDGDYYKRAFGDIAETLFKAGRDEEAQKLVKTVKPFAVEYCQAEIYKAKKSRLTQRMHDAARRGAYDEVLRALIDDEPFNDGAFGGFPEIGREKKDVEQLVRIYRQIPSERAKARTYIVVGLLWAVNQ